MNTFVFLLYLCLFALPATPKAPEHLEINHISFKEGIQISQSESVIEVAGSSSDAEDCKLISFYGQEVAMSKFRGETLYIYVWASYIQPSIERAGEWNEFNERWKGKADHFITVSLDGPGREEQWKSKLASMDLKGEHYLADSEGWGSDFVKTYSISSIPSTIYITKKGKRRY